MMQGNIWITPSKDRYCLISNLYPAFIKVWLSTVNKITFTHILVIFFHFLVIGRQYSQGLDLYSSIAWFNRPALWLHVCTTKLDYVCFLITLLPRFYVLNYLCWSAYTILSVFGSVSSVSFIVYIIEFLLHQLCWHLLTLYTSYLEKIEF